MNIILRYAYMTALIGLLAWMIGAFVSLEPNPLDWQESSRFNVVVIMIASLLAYWLLEDV